VDTIKSLARDRHFHTEEIRLADYGQVLLVGDRRAVDRLLDVIREHAAHDLIRIESDHQSGDERLSRFEGLRAHLPNVGRCPRALSSAYQNHRAALLLRGQGA
jgi:hypothetical protein